MQYAKKILLALSGLVLVIVLFVAAFIVSVPVRNWGAFAAARAEAATHEAEVPTMIHRLLEIFEHQRSCLAVSREIMDRVPAEEQERIRVNWLPYSLAWYIATQSVVGEKNCRVLITRRFRLGPLGGNFSQAARTVFSKPLSELTLEEAAVLVVITRAPQRYLGNLDRLNSGVENLMQRYRDEP